VLEPLFSELQSEQLEAGVDFPLYLSIDAAGLVESWVNGTSWRDLCKETSLDQGDVCRMFRRTVEVLREIPSSYGVPPRIAQLASNAFLKMDRFPVADIDPAVEEGSKETTAGVGFEFASRSATSEGSNSDVLSDESEVFDDLELDKLLDDGEEGSDDEDDDLDDGFRGIDVLDDESVLRYISLGEDEGLDSSNGTPSLDDIDLIARLQSMDTDVNPRKMRTSAAKERNLNYGSQRETIRRVK